MGCEGMQVDEVVWLPCHTSKTDGPGAATALCSDEIGAQWTHPRRVTVPFFLQPWKWMHPLVILVGSG